MINSLRRVKSNWQKIRSACLIIIGMIIFINSMINLSWVFVIGSILIISGLEDLFNTRKQRNASTTEQEKENE